MPKKQKVVYKGWAGATGHFDALPLMCRVSDVMTPDPLVVRPETNIEAAARILLQKKVRRLPVVDDTGRLIGMFTRGDVIKAALRARKAALEKNI